MDTQERETTVQEIWKLFRETDRKFRETQRELRRSSLETDRMFRETDRKLDRLSEDVEKTRQQVSDLTDGWGRFVESMVEPAVIRLFAERGIVLEGTSQRVSRRRNGRGMEIDLLAVNQEYVVAVEVKTTLRADDVKDHLERLDEFKTFFTEYRDRKVIGAVAGMSLQEGVDKYAERQGLYVLAQSGETVRMLNDEDFEAHVW